MNDEQSRNVPCKQIAPPLEQVVTEIFERRTKQGKLVFGDPAIFLDKLHELAKRHSGNPSIEVSKDGRQRYKAITRALGQLQRALEELNGDELDLLSSEQLRHRDALPPGHDYDEHYEDTQYVGDPYNLKDLLFNNTFLWLYSASNVLSINSKTGRPQHTAELQLTKDFLYICHSEHWPVTAANSGSERRKSNPTESDAVICLAALFVETGKNPIESMRNAKTMLRKLRIPIDYHQQSDVCYEYIWEAKIDLRGIKYSSHLGALPNFVPSAPPSKPPK